MQAITRWSFFCYTRQHVSFFLIGTHGPPLILLRSLFVSVDESMKSLRSPDALFGNVTKEGQRCWPVAKQVWALYR